MQKPIMASHRVRRSRNELFDISIKKAGWFVVQPAFFRFGEMEKGVLSNLVAGPIRTGPKGYRTTSRRSW